MSDFEIHHMCKNLLASSYKCCKSAMIQKLAKDAMDVFEPGKETNVIGKW